MTVMWLFLAALALRGAVLVVIRPDIHPRLWEYDEVARNLIGGRGFTFWHFDTTYVAFVEPLYPFLAAAVHAVSGQSYLALVLVQLVLSALLAPVVFAIGRRLHAPIAGGLAAAIVVVHPGFVAYALKYHPLTLDALLTASVILATLRLRAVARPAAAVAWGAVTGLCLLSRPTMLLVLPVIGAWLLADRGWRMHARALGVAVLVAVAVVSPWLARNYRALGHLVLGRSNVGYMLWIGNNPLATGSLWIDHDTPVAARMPAELRTAVAAEKGEIGQDRHFRTAALTYIAAEPMAFVMRYVRKLFYFWWFAPTSGREYGALFTWYKGWYAVLLALAVIGAAARRGTDVDIASVVLVVAVPIGFSVVQSLFFVEGRHRLAVEWALVVLAGCGVHAMGRALAVRHPRLRSLAVVPRGPMQ